MAPTKTTIQVLLFLALALAIMPPFHRQFRSLACYRSHPLCAVAQISEAAVLVPMLHAERDAARWVRQIATVALKLFVDYAMPWISSTSLAVWNFTMSTLTAHVKSAGCCYSVTRQLSIVGFRDLMSPLHNFVASAADILAPILPVDTVTASEATKVPCRLAVSAWVIYFMVQVAFKLWALVVRVTLVAQGVYLYLRRQPEPLAPRRAATPAISNQHLSDTLRFRLSP